MKKLKIHTRSRANPFCSGDKKAYAKMIQTLSGELLNETDEIFSPRQRKMMPRLMNIDEWTCTNLVEARQSKLSEAVTELLIRVTPPVQFSPLTPFDVPNMPIPFTLQRPQVRRKIPSARRHRRNVRDFLRQWRLFQYFRIWDQWLDIKEFMTKNAQFLHNSFFLY